MSVLWIDNSDSEYMIKPVHLIITLLIGILIGILIVIYWPSRDTGNVEDPIIHKLKEEIGWRDFKEKKTQERIKRDSIEKKALAKDVIIEREKLRQAEARYNQVRKAVPLTRSDTITFLMSDTVACDSALLRSKELVAGLTIEVVTDEAIIKGLDSLNSDLQADKKDLVKIDSLHIQTEKQLRKANRKKFFKGLGVGGVLGAIAALLL